MVVYCVDRESDGSPVGEADSPAGILDLVERAGPGSYRVQEYLVPYGVPSLPRAWPRGLPRTWRGSASSTREVAVSIARGPWGRTIDVRSGNGPELPVDDDPRPGELLAADAQVPERQPVAIPREAVGQADRHETVQALEHADAAWHHAPADRPWSRDVGVIPQSIARSPAFHHLWTPSNGRLTGLAMVHYPGFVPVLPTPGGSPGE